MPAIAAGQSLGSPPYGTSTGSGTLSAVNPKVTFSDGPFIVPNPSAQTSILNLAVSVPTTPTCTSTAAVPGAPLSTNQCDYFTL
ncbi:MAG TPA: hypothetical protein VNN08_04865, partial [Thermoanaerobaculia bacterium]|nr:hypothetical protein [Thermoanaerobaculia bacterium]